jgi:N-formylglutamate amidohydrolase
MSSVPFRLWVFAICGLVLTSLGVRAAFGESETSSLVTVEIGDVPIILSAPHGGGDVIPGVAERQGEGVISFKTRSDFNTAKLTEQLANAIEKKLGNRPYTVISRFHRKYVDANRPPPNAYETKQAKSTYDAYHQALEQARRDVIERWGRGVLFDIHGQAAEPKAIFRGTQNGEATTHLVNRFGREALSGETSVFGQLASQGLPMIPAVGSTDREHVNYDGGYIVATYGSDSGGTLDAIQLELGRELRTTKAIPTTASQLSNAIAAFATGYLPEAERTSKSDDRKQETKKPIAVANAGKGAGGAPLFSDDFADENRDGWFEVDDDSSTLSVKSKSGQMGSLPELTFAASDKSSLKSFAAHFPEVKLKQTSDFVTLQFDARHNNVGFGDRGFRFGLFNSRGTRFRKDGDFDNESISPSEPVARLPVFRSTTSS